MSAPKITTSFIGSEPNFPDANELPDAIIGLRDSLRLQPPLILQVLKSTIFILLVSFQVVYKLDKINRTVPIPISFYLHQLFASVICSNAP
jgi:hypothetical protein